MPGPIPEGEEAITAAVPPAVRREGVIVVVASAIPAGVVVVVVVAVAIAASRGAAAVAVVAGVVIVVVIVVVAKVPRANVFGVDAGGNLAVAVATVSKVHWGQILPFLAVVHKPVHDDGPLADVSPVVVAISPAAPGGGAAAAAVAVVVVVVVVAVAPSTSIGGAATASVAIVVVVVAVVVPKQPRVDVLRVDVLRVDAGIDPAVEILAFLPPVHKLVHGDRPLADPVASGEKVEQAGVRFFIISYLGIVLTEIFCRVKRIV